MREFVGGEFAQEYCATVIEFGGNCGIRGGNVILQDAGIGGRCNAGGVKNILERKRDAV